MPVGALGQEDALRKVRLNIILNNWGLCVVFDFDPGFGIFTYADVFFYPTVIVSASYN